jgi:hypothetical protein
MLIIMCAFVDEDLHSIALLATLQDHRMVNGRFCLHMLDYGIEQNCLFHLISGYHLLDRILCACHGALY